MVRSFRVKDLNGKLTFALDLHDDLNVVTGKNGCGKTTMLKSMWFMISGNLERIVPEIRFRHAEIVTDTFSLSLEQQPAQEGVIVMKWSFTPVDGVAETGAGPSDSRKLQRLNRSIVTRPGSSLFFPTFRRIEGGFSMGTRQRVRDVDGRPVYVEGAYEIESALDSMAHALSVRTHRFVSSISTSDIVTAVTRQYANVSEQLNEDYRQLSDRIRQAIVEHGRPSSGPGEPEKGDATRVTLEKISQEVREHSQKQDNIHRPFVALSELIQKIFRHKGIKVTERITLGDVSEAMASEWLSAGEKQMLSFLVYNAFEIESVIFIDEPEISLHVDWQRQLFPTLLAQGTKNQFIVATHSPFIYSSYSDKELLLDADRGD